MSWTIDEAAAVMGMPPHEVIAVAEVGDYHVVSTHDGQKTIVTEAGKAVLVKPDATEAEIAAELGITEAEFRAQLDRDEAVDLAAEGEPEDVPPAVGGENGGAGPETDPVPDVDAKELLAWVGDDQARAVRALEAEQAREKPRSTVVTALEKVAQA